MTLSPFTEAHFPAIAKLYVEVFSEPGIRQWNEETAMKYLRYNLDQGNDYCWVALNEENECVGSIFAMTMPYYQSEILFIDSLQIEEKYRHQGLATLLLQKVFEVAKQNHIHIVHLLADARKGFPREWYEGMGFELTGWAEYEGEVDKIAL